VPAYEFQRPAKEPTDSLLHAVGAVSHTIPKWERRRVGPKVGPASVFCSCILTGMHGPTRIFLGHLDVFLARVTTVHVCVNEHEVCV
jgi:hypothetical protein